MSASHERMYARTIDSFADAVAKESFSEDAIPHLVEGLRKELGQCLEFGLISAEFYAERMAILQRVVGLLV